MMDKVCFGIIGVGGMGAGPGRNFPMIPDVGLPAVCDIAPAALEMATRNFEVPGFDNQVALLDSRLMDAVIIATPHRTTSAHPSPWTRCGAAFTSSADYRSALWGVKCKT